MIEYSLDITKHFCIWASLTKQVVIASKLYIDEFEKSGKLLAKWPLDVTQMKKKALVGEVKSKDRPQKNLIIETRIETSSLEVEDKEEEVAMSITNTISKIYKPGLYNEVVNDPIHGRCWRETIKKELQNLESHQI